MAVEEEKPTAAFVLSLIGGIISLVMGLVFIVISLTIPVYYYYYIFVGVGFYYLYWLIIGIWVIISGVLIIVGAVELNSHPEKHTQWGTIILIFSILGGGGCLGLVGGILALTWKPSAAPPSRRRARQVVARVCPQCGTVLEEDVKFCPSCGWSTSGRKGGMSSSFDERPSSRS